MNLWQRGLSAVRNMARRRDTPIRYYRWLQADAPAGIVITAESALQLSVVWGCVMAITNAIAACRWNVFRVEGEQRTLLPDDPVDYLLNVRPNPEMTAIGVREALQIGALTWGNGYGEIVRNGKGQAVELWPLMSDRVLPRRRPEAPYRLYYEYHQETGETVELEQEDVYHLRGPGITGLMGDNLVARAAKSMGLAAAQERFAATYFGNNTILGGVLETPGKLQPDAHKRLKDDWEDRYKGPFKANRPAILEGGLTYKPFTNDADSAQALESRQFSVEDICRWYGVPPHKVQHLLRSTFSNIEHLGIEFARDALTPWAIRAQQEADYKFFPQRGPRRETKLDMGWLTHGDAKSRFDAYQIGLDRGIWTVNEVRAFEGKNSIGKVGDTRLVPLNMTTLEAMANTPADAMAKKSQPQDPATSPDDGTASPGDANGDAADAPPVAQKPGKRDAKNAVLASAHMVIEASLDRYQRRLAARESDLRRRDLAEPKVRLNLAAEREKQQPRVLEECRSALDLLVKWMPGAATRDADAALLSALTDVDNGAGPGDAALHLLETIARPETT